MSVTIKGVSLDAYARAFLNAELKDIRAQLEAGFLANEEPKTIANRIVGSPALNRCNGVTHTTRTRIKQLAWLHDKEQKRKK
jgi:hypothetical protein